MEQQILVRLQGMKATDRPLTFGDIARQFGVGYAMAARCAQLMVGAGLAKPAMLPGGGTPVLHGLLPHPGTDGAL